MLYYIKGMVAYTGEDYIVLDNNEIGYKIFTSYTSIAEVHTTEKTTMYTVLVHREDDMSIYGFTTQDELKVFQLLTTVSGVGSKLANGILSSIPYSQLVGMISSEDITGLLKAHGVGKKTAQRIVLELKDKVDHTLLFKNVGPAMQSRQDHHIEEAIHALISLGYVRSEAEKAVAMVKEDAINIEELIKKALRCLIR